MKYETTTPCTLIKRKSQRVDKNNRDFETLLRLLEIWDISSRHQSSHSAGCLEPMFAHSKKYEDNKILRCGFLRKVRNIVNFSDMLIKNIRKLVKKSTFSGSLCTVDMNDHGKFSLRWKWWEVIRDVKCMRNVWEMSAYCELCIVVWYCHLFVSGGYYDTNQMPLL